MKIKAISSRHSSKEGVALVTNPPLTAAILQEAEQRVRTPALKALMLREASGCLLVHSDLYTSELRVQLEQLLTDAEELVSGNAARKQAELEELERKLTLQSAAAGFGLPIV